MIRNLMNSGDEILVRDSFRFKLSRIPLSWAATLLGFTWADKGHPDEQDPERARAFAKALLSR